MKFKFSSRLFTSITTSFTRCAHRRRRWRRWRVRRRWRPVTTRRNSFSSSSVTWVTTGSRRWNTRRTACRKSCKATTPTWGTGPGPRGRRATAQRVPPRRSRSTRRRARVTSVAPARRRLWPRWLTTTRYHGLLNDVTFQSRLQSQIRYHCL